MTDILDYFRFMKKEHGINRFGVVETINDVGYKMYAQDNEGNFVPYLPYYDFLKGEVIGNDDGR